MQAHEQRVVNEAAEMTIKLANLGDFIQSAAFDHLPFADRILLIEQHQAMTKYSDVLHRRVARFTV
jgi:hypothetical protein